MIKFIIILLFICQTVVAGNHDERNQWIDTYSSCKKKYPNNEEYCTKLANSKHPPEINNGPHTMQQGGQDPALPVGATPDGQGIEGSYGGTSNGPVGSPGLEMGEQSPYGNSAVEASVLPSGKIVNDSKSNTPRKERFLDKVERD